MKVLSATGCPVPPLIVNVCRLAPEVVERLDLAEVPPLHGHLLAAYRDALRLLGRVAKEQDVFDPGGVQSERQERVLEDMQMVMHRLSAFGDTLKKAGRIALPSPARKNKKAQLVEDRIDYRLERNVKIPINMIKHNEFRMQWITLTLGQFRVHGYCIRGSIGPKTNGPIKFRRKDKNSPEAYSFGYVLRDCVLALFDMADSLDKALEDADLYVADPIAQQVASTDVEKEALAQVNALTDRGFPDEKGFKIPVFRLQGGTVAATLRGFFPLQGARVTTSLTGVAGGVTYQMPYMADPSGFS